jgi:glycosyltransferase involved in cell wall biosynthesis
VTEKYEPKSIDLVILMPVFNDWDAATALIEQIDSVLGYHDIRPVILLVDDGSETPVPVQLVRKALHKVQAIDVLRLRRNLGHQRAIAAGLTYVFQKIPCDAVLVMDSDGEDRPEDIPRLIEEFRSAGGDKVIFAKRTKRMETPLFKICYRFYQIFHRILTGMGVHVGNFSIIPFHCLSALVVSPELWNHYAAAIFKLRLPVGMIDTSRGKRLFGKSRMNFVALVIHGLSAISVFGEVVATRLLISACGMSILLIGALVAVIAVRLFTDHAVSGWATYTGGILMILLVLIATITSGFLLSVLSNRNMASFLPLRDAPFQIRDTKRIYAASKESDVPRK